MGSSPPWSVSKPAGACRRGLPRQNSAQKHYRAEHLAMPCPARDCAFTKCGWPNYCTLQSLGWRRTRRDHPMTAIFCSWVRSAFSSSHFRAISMTSSLHTVEYVPSSWKWSWSAGISLLMTFILVLPLLSSLAMRGFTPVVH